MASFSYQCACFCLSSKQLRFCQSSERAAALSDARFKNCKYSTRFPVCCVNSSTPADQRRSDACMESGRELPRRDAIFLGLASFIAASASPLAANAEPVGATGLPQPEQTLEAVDQINSYSYLYPTGVDVTVGNRGAPVKLNWVESRKPERYSSAAPLAPDARQRIVSERIDFKDNIVVSVSIGPPNLNILKSTETTDWDAKDVGRSVLADKSTARMTSGQRVAEITFVDSFSKEIDGKQYWYYEYLTQKSPTITQRGLDVFRHSVAVTVERDGYLYTLNVSTIDTNWSKFSSALQGLVASFQLLPATGEYVPPYKDPWRFW